MWLPSWATYAPRLLFIVSSVLATCPPQDSIAPCVCTTRADELQIWCSHSELSTVLAGLKSVGTQVTRPVDELILENNAMTALPGQAFSPLKVVRLMLRDNKLERVAANWLAGLEDSLLEVFIVEHELRSLPEESLETMVKLEALTLKAGHLNRIPNMSNLPKLRYINIELPSLTELTPGRVNNLDSLETLQIIGSPGLKTLEASVLQDLPRLVIANFTGCGISWIHPRAMSRLPSLKELAFSKNNIVDAGEVGRSIRELPHLAVLRLDDNIIDALRETSFVDIPPLQEIYLNNNKIVEIQRGAFHRLPQLKKLDLSENRIRRIYPEFFLQSYESSIEEVSLVQNELDHIMALTILLDTLPRLKFLDMSNNRLQDIMFGAMRGHPTLERLHLNNNHLKRVVREAFNGMPALRELRLRNNSLSNYLEMPLWNLPSLKGLDLSHNEFRRLDRRVLANLPSLRRLDMSQNQLIVVDPASFLGTASLEHVNLSYNAIDSISSQTFPHLDRLFDLDVSNNRLTTVVPGLPRGVEYLYLSNNQISQLPRAPSPELLLPALRSLDLNGNKLHSLPPESFISIPLLRRLSLGGNLLQKIDERCLDGLGRLEYLDLQDNRLTLIHSEAFRDLRRLQDLNLHSNRLDRLQPALLKENKALKKVDLSNNQMTSMDVNALEHNRDLREISLSRNSLNTFPDAVRSLPSLQKLDLSYNRIYQLIRPLSELKSLAELNLSKNKLHTLIDGTFSQMDNLTVLDLESNEIQYLTPHIVRSNPSLFSLRLSRNKLTSVPSAAFSDLPQLTEVELQENELTHLASDAFSGVPNLLMLNLSHNHLTSLDRAGLQGLKSMEILDISHNRVTRLNSPSLPQLDSLIQLKMDGNRVCAIQGSPFSKMSHLRFLSLRNNKLVSVSETAMQPLRATIYQLDIEGNPLRCSCGLVWLNSWNKDGGPYQGPRCMDGSEFLEYRQARQGCPEPKYADPLCDEQIPPNRPTQQLSSTSFQDPNRKPLPEETDYFYEDYIEYEENASLPIQLASSSTIIPTAIVPPPPQSSTTRQPPPMSHFVAGDTPTLYAKPADEAKNNKPKTTYTFFGMPLPSISLGNFWGSSRKQDGRGRFTGITATVQQVPSPPNKVEEGFRPMLSDVSGGFRPIFNPYEKKTEERGKKVFPVGRPNDWISTTAKSLIVTNVGAAGKVQDQSVIRATDTIKEPASNQPALFQYNRMNPTQFDLITTSTEIASEEVVHTIPPTNIGAIQTYLSTSKTSTPLSFREVYVEDSSEMWETPMATSSSTILPTTTNSQTLPNNKTIGGPSPLSGFLAPGGQLPPVRTPVGRPIITKVAQPQSPPMPIAEEIQGPQPVLKNGEFQSTGKSKKNQSISWYFKNYNNTNLRPYIGPPAFSGKGAAIKTFPEWSLKYYLFVLVFLRLVA
ncbi:artichoke isoform X2 [Rhodnius prolixus]|uniref:artichoke isoform X2 n=1 Tax=Rhodnius prolixus TaxID=13249 RepID=UPI003D189571